MRTFVLTIVVVARGAAGGCAEVLPGGGAPHGVDGAYVARRMR